MYKDIENIYKNTRLDAFLMASSHLMDIGWRRAVQMTDEQIAQVEGNGLMTAEFCQMLCRVARDIAKAGSPVEFIQFCQVNELYDTSFIEGEENEDDYED